MIPAMIIGPSAQLLALGYAANLDVPASRWCWWTRTARPPAGPSSSASPAPALSICGAEDTVEPIDPWLVEGRAQLALVIAPGFGEAVAAAEKGHGPGVQVIADGTDANSAGLGLAYASRILAQVEPDAATSSPPQSQPAAPARGDCYELVPRVWYNPDLKSRWFYVPRCSPWC